MAIRRCCVNVEDDDDVSVRWKAKFEAKDDGKKLIRMVVIDEKSKKSNDGATCALVVWFV